MHIHPINGPHTDVNAIEGVRVCPLTTAKCQNEISVTRTGVALLYQYVVLVQLELSSDLNETITYHIPFQSVFGTNNSERIRAFTGSARAYLDNIIQSLVFQLLLSDFEDFSFKAPLPGHKLSTFANR